MNTCEINKKLNKILTKSFLKKEYIKNKKSTVQIAQEIHCGVNTINRHLKRNIIKIRTKSELNSGKNNTFYIDGRKTANYFCIKCQAKISYPTWFIGSKMCLYCARKGTNNPNYGNHFSEEIKQKIRDSKYHKNLKKENNPNWKDGKSNEPYPLEFNEKLKEKIRKRDNYQCQNLDCNVTEEEHLIVFGRVLDVHHIDYNKTNINIENLISLCQSCHMKTNYNREYWQEYFKKEIICSIG